MLGLLLYVKEKLATCKMAMNFEPLLYYTPNSTPQKTLFLAKRGHCQFSMKHNNSLFTIHTQLPSLSVAQSLCIYNIVEYFEWGIDGTFDARDGHCHKGLF